jgi:hypothetical protein
MMADEEEVVAGAATPAVGRLKDLGSHSMVVSQLRQGPSSQDAALRSLDVLWQTDDFDLVLAIAAGASRRPIRRLASSVLALHTDERDWRRLLTLWRSSELARERVWACNLVASFGGKEDLRFAEAFASDSDGHVRKAARRASQNGP